jgi:pimeloyl-ACP methyl ester carboxylesterase
MWHAIARLCFRLCIPNRRWEMPRVPGAREFTAWTPEGNAIRGWCARPDAPPRATVLIVHGITRNCTLDGIPRWGRLLLRAGCAVTAIDLRGHGHSDDGITTFGAGEARDLRAALDACVEQGMPGPYLVVGGSLGALAAQRAAIDDPRIAGLVLLSMPAWPWQGIKCGGEAVAEIFAWELSRRIHPAIAHAVSKRLRVIGRAARLVAMVVNAAHGHDILAAGDIRRLVPPPSTRVLSITGDHDTYDWRLTRAAWRRWGRGERCRAGLSPAEAPRQGSWFMLAKGYHHPPIDPHVLQWPRLPRALLELVEQVAPRPGRTPA